MVWEGLFSALALVLIIEGLLPCINPDAWRRAVSAVSQLNDSQLRRAGLISMVIGAILLYLIRV